MYEPLKCSNMLTSGRIPADLCPETKDGHRAFQALAEAASIDDLKKALRAMSLKRNQMRHKKIRDG